MHSHIILYPKMFQLNVFSGKTEVLAHAMLSFSKLSVVNFSRKCNLIPSISTYNCLQNQNLPKINRYQYFNYNILSSLVRYVNH